MKAEERAKLIGQYRDGHRVVREAFAGIKEDELDSSASGEWTPRQIAHHLADSETMSYLRLRRLLAEDHPAIQGYDEPEYARRLHYDRPIASSLEVFRAVRVASAELLDALGEDEWVREGTHSESGRYTMNDWLEIYAAHAHDHAAQMLRAQMLRAQRSS